MEPWVNAMIFGGRDNEKVVEIGQHLMQNRFPEIAEVDAYWTALKGPRLVPGRLDIDPRGIEGALGHVMLLERIAPGVARIRLAGNHLSDLMGMDVRGMPVSALIAPQDRARFADHLEQVFTAPAKMVAELAAERAIGKPKLDARLLVLPLSDGDGRITRALACLSTHGTLGRAPRRFGLEAQQCRPLSGAIPLPLPRVYAMAEAPQPFDRPDLRRADSAPRKPYLRLVASDD